MKISLVVMSAGSMQNKVIPMSIGQFLIGRDKTCHLRPASPMVSNRHCALLVRGKKLFIRDLGSTNGTIVNESVIAGETELYDKDTLQVGPVMFRLSIEQTAPVASASSMPHVAGNSDDDDAAALLLSVPEEGAAVVENPSVDSEGIPTGSTVYDISPAALIKEQEAKEKAEKDKAKAKSADTASAADTILQKYMRRPRR